MMLVKGFFKHTLSLKGKNVPFFNHKWLIAEDSNTQSLHEICLHISRQLAQNFLAIHQVCLRNFWTT